MGFFDDVGDFISDVADTAAGVVEDVVNAVEEVVTDVVETVGNAVEDAATAVGDFLSGVPLIGGLLSGFFRWLGTAISAIFDLVGAVIKGVLGIISGVVAGLIRVIIGGIGGLIEWDASVFIKGIGDITSGVGGAVVLILGKFLGAVQAIFFLQWGERRLTDAERELLERVYRGSVALYNVRIIEGFAGLYSLNDRPFTLGNTIYMKDTNPTSRPEVLVHECGHVWQYQNLGARYTTNALWAQWTIDDAYDWESEISGGITRWEDLNPEAQCEFLEDLFLGGNVIRGPNPPEPGIFYKDEPIGNDVVFVKGGVDHTSFAREGVDFLRGAWAWRLSNLF